KAVVTGLGDAAEIERIAILVADDEAEEIHVEISACRQVADREHRMAGARDVERRTVDRLRNAHGALQPTLFESETFLEHGSMKWGLDCRPCPFDCSQGSLPKSMMPSGSALSMEMKMEWPLKRSSK